MTPVLAMTVVREAAIAAFTPEKFHRASLETDRGVMHGISRPHS